MIGRSNCRVIADHTCQRLSSTFTQLELEPWLGFNEMTDSNGSVGGRTGPGVARLRSLAHAIRNIMLVIRNACGLSLCKENWLPDLLPGIVRNSLISKASSKCTYLKIRW